ncbi:MAG: ABC transporter substrate-binding protein [Gammaproteobacteria bacterium]|nr:ABC transporter substrate-binding protein [Gammaproteobacteria bacterium]
MLKKVHDKILPIVFLCILTTSTWAAEVFSTSPVLNDGQKWRMAFYEGGHHANYYHYLEATILGLMRLGWIEKSDLEKVRSKKKDTKRLWNWLADNVKSDYLEFVEDGYYSANWDDEQRQKNRSQLLKRLASEEEIDLIIAMGTWAGLDLANNEHSVPTMVMSTSDPVKSGIIKSQDDSGYDHVHARVDPYRYERQLRIFHEIIKFKKLGIAFEDSIYGRSYSAIDTVEKVAADIGFEVVKCYTKSDISNTDIASQSVIRCFDKLAKQVDAMYVTIQGGVNPESIPRLVEIANKNSIPTFSQLGSKEVQQGFLFSISRSGFKPAGLFLSATIAQILNGAKPRQLKQVFEETPSIAINLKTAEIVGLYLYADILAAADTIYRDIKNP